MLDGAGDATGEINVWRDSGAGLANLVGVVAPAVVGHGSRTADDSGEFSGEFLERRKTLGRANPSTSTNDDPGRSQGDAGSPFNAVRHGGSSEGGIERGDEGRASLGDRKRHHVVGVMRDRDEFDRCT